MDRGSKQINKLKQELICIPQPSNKPQGIFWAETQRHCLTPGPNPAVGVPHTPNTSHFKTLPQKNLLRAVSTCPAGVLRLGGRVRCSNYSDLQE